MAYIGQTPTAVALDGDDLANDIITLAKMASGTDGNIISYDASGNPVAIATGSSGQVLTSGGAGAAPSFAAGGKVLQVLTATDSTSRSTTGTSFVTGSNSLSVDMTLASTANKVLIICSLAVATNTANGQAIYTIYKDSTNIGPAAGFVTHYANMGTITNPYRSGASMVTLYSPSSTSTITYQVYMKSNGVGTIYINQTSTTSTITVLEIEG